MTTAHPHRLISLLPGATELLCALGLENQLVGVSHECDFPPTVNRLPRVSATAIRHEASSLEIDAEVRAAVASGLPLYQLDLAQLRELAPSLLISQSLCAVCGVDSDTVSAALCAVPEAAQQFNFSPSRLDDLFAAITELGTLLGVAAQASTLRHGLERRVATVAERTRALRVPRPRVVFLEWLAPFFAGGHWNPELVELAGGTPLLGEAGQKSSAFDWATLEAADPDVLFIACCGFSTPRALQELPAVTAHPAWPHLRAVRAGRVYVTDGNAYFNRPGPRLVDSLDILAHALHPAVHPLPAGLPAATAIGDGAPSILMPH